MKFLRYILFFCSFIFIHIHAQANDSQSESVINSSIIASYSTSNELKLISETTGVAQDHLGYSYIELGSTPFEPTFSKWVYLQLLWEQKFWKTPLFIHAEIRALLGDNTPASYQCFAGCAYSIPLNCGYITIEPLYRYSNIDGHGAQLSVVGGYDWKYFNLAHFTDIYKASQMQVPLTMYNECRFYYKVSHRFEVGVVGILSYSFQCNTEFMSAALAAKVNL